MTGTAQAITVTLVLDGLPPECPHCEAPPPDGQWAIGVHGHLLQVICARCFTAIAPVTAAAALPAPHYHDSAETGPCTCPVPGTYAPRAYPSSPRC